MQLPTFFETLRVLTASTLFQSLSLKLLSSIETSHLDNYLALITTTEIRNGQPQLFTLQQFFAEPGHGFT